VVRCGSVGFQTPTQWKHTSRSVPLVFWEYEEMGLLLLVVIIAVMNDIGCSVSLSEIQHAHVSIRLWRLQWVSVFFHGGKHASCGEIQSEKAKVWVHDASDARVESLVDNSHAPSLCSSPMPLLLPWLTPSLARCGHNSCWLWSARALSCTPVWDPDFGP
jgi:hypothetical protein